MGNIKIVLVVVFSFIIATSTLFVILDWYKNHGENYEEQEMFFLHEFDETQKNIFILGSSQTGRINATFVDNYLAEKFGKDSSDSYNLATPGDLPRIRQTYTGMIISANPDLVLYGIGFRDFESSFTVVETTNNKPEDVFPGAQDFFNRIFKLENFFNYDFSALSSPLLVITSMIASVLMDNTNIVKMDSNTPFYDYYEGIDEIKSKKELKEILDSKPKWRGISIENNDNVQALKKILNEFSKRDVKVVIFTTPHDRVILDSMPTKDKEKFEYLLRDISEELDVKTYYFHEKYADMNIWQSIAHVAVSNKTDIFSQDIAEIILENLET